MYDTQEGKKNFRSVLAGENRFLGDINFFNKIIFFSYSSSLAPNIQGLFNLI